MEVRIGVLHAPRELIVDTQESIDDIEKQVATAVESDGVLVLTDTRGRRYVVPASKLAYVEIGTGYDERRVGFGAP